MRPAEEIRKALAAITALEVHMEPTNQATRDECSGVKKALQWVLRMPGAFDQELATVQKLNKHINQ